MLRRVRLGMFCLMFDWTRIGGFPDRSHSATQPLGVAEWLVVRVAARVQVRCVNGLLNCPEKGPLCESVLFQVPRSRKTLQKGTLIALFLGPRLSRQLRACVLF